MTKQMRKREKRGGGFILKIQSYGWNQRTAEILMGAN